MIRLYSWAYIKYYLKLPKRKREILRKMASNKRKEFWQVRREAHPWVFYKDLTIGTILFIILPVELLMCVFYFIGQLLLNWGWLQ